MADPPSVFRFHATFEHVETRSVRRSLETEDDTDPNILWWIRAVPLGHSVMFYLCRNMITQYGEIRYEYSIVNGDAQLETGVNRHAVMRATDLLEEYMPPAMALPVNPRRNWFIVQVKLQHLRPDEYQNHNVEEHGQHEELKAEDPLEGCSQDTFVSSERKDITERLLYMNMYSKQNLEMFTKQLHSDLDVYCGSTLIKTHKSVLSAHAVVFRQVMGGFGSMFGYEFTRESQTSTLIIDGYSLYSVLLMFQWCYTGELDVLDKGIVALYDIYDVPDKLPDEVLLECTELADKYALDSLQLLCEQQWVDRVYKDNVCLYLVYAEIYQLYSLRMSCVEMITSNPEVINSVEWEQVRCYGSETAKRLESTLKSITKEEDRNK